MKLGNTQCRKANDNKLFKGAFVPLEVECAVPDVHTLPSHYLMRGVKVTINDVNDLRSAATHRYFPPQ